MKVLFYNHTGEVSGAERVLLLILAHLDRAAFDSTVICPHGPLEKMCRDLGVRVETVTTLEARFTWRADQLVRYAKSFCQIINELRRRVRRIKPDLVHANSIRSGLVATAATFGMGTRVIWHLHDILPHHPLSTAIRLFALLSTRTRMIAVSQAVAKNFGGRLAGLMSGRIGVILNAIDLDKFQPDLKSRNAIRQDLGLKEDDMVFGIVGQLTERKGQLELIQAFARAGIPRSVLLISGAAIFNRDREYASRLRTEVEALGLTNSVRMLGARNDVCDVMQSLDLLIVNSSAEPFGLVIVEAMACGTPVLAAAVDGIPEIIDHNRTGWLVPLRDQALLVQSMLQLSCDPELRRRLAEQGKQHAKLFNTDRYLSELQSFYRDSSNATVAARSTEGTTQPAETAKFA